MNSLQLNSTEDALLPLVELAQQSNSGEIASLVKLAISESFPTFHFELVPVRAFEHDPLFSLIDYRSRLAEPWTNFSYYPVFQEVAHIELQGSL